MKKLIISFLLVLSFFLWGEEKRYTPPAKPDKIGLSEYQAGKPTRLKKISYNASGMTYSPVTKTLFIILDSPTVVVEYTCTGEYIRNIKLSGLIDPEGITHVAGDTFAIVDEYRGALYEITISEKTKKVNVKLGRTIKVTRGGDNHGLEGIAYDAGSQKYYIVKEHDPMRIYEVSRKSGTAIRLFSPSKLGISDLSGIFFHKPTGNLVLLSHESSTVVECTTKGEVKGRKKVNLYKAEGIAMDENGTLYICGEPNVFQVFQNPEIKEEKQRMKTAYEFILDKAAKDGLHSISMMGNKNADFIKYIVRKKKYKLKYEDYNKLKRADDQMYYSSDPKKPVAILSIAKREGRTYYVAYFIGPEGGASKEIILKQIKGKWIVSNNDDKWAVK